MSLSQASLVPSLTQMAKMELSGKVAKHCNAQMISFLRPSYMRRRRKMMRASCLPHRFQLVGMTLLKGEQLKRVN